MSEPQQRDGDTPPPPTPSGKEPPADTSWITFEKIRKSNDPDKTERR
jgi:hypothetical protein